MVNKRVPESPVAAYVQGIVFGGAMFYVFGDHVAWLPATIILALLLALGYVIERGEFA